MPPSDATLSAGTDRDSSLAWLSIFPAVLTAAGVVLFGLLTIGYSVFYDRLGVSPEAVGFGYVTTLTRSSGFVALVALAAAMAAAVYVQRQLEAQARTEFRRTSELLFQEDRERAWQRARDDIKRHDALLARAKAEVERAKAAAFDPESEEALTNEGMKLFEDVSKAEDAERKANKLREAALEREPEREASLGGPSLGELGKRRIDALYTVRDAVRRWSPVAIAALVGLLAAVVLLVIPRANEVRADKAVGPIQVLGIIILDVRAQHARLELIEGDKPPVALTRLARRPLLYLGQGNGTVIMFAHDRDEAVHVPASAVVVRVEVERRGRNVAIARAPRRAPA